MRNNIEWVLQISYKSWIQDDATFVITKNNNVMHLTTVLTCGLQDKIWHLILTSLASVVTKFSTQSRFALKIKSRIRCCCFVNSEYIVKTQFSVAGRSARVFNYNITASLTWHWKKRYE